MKPGSLVTAAYSKMDAAKKIGAMAPHMAIYIQDLPEPGQVYTVEIVTPPCPCCGKRYCHVEEMKVFRAPKEKYGITTDFYIEIAPAEETNLNEFINSIADSVEMPDQIVLVERV